MLIWPVDPENEEDILAVGTLEKLVFSSSGDSAVKNREDLKFIAREGRIFLGYEIAKKGERIPDDLAGRAKAGQTPGEKIIPVAFAQLVSLEKGLEFYRDNKNVACLQDNAFMISKRNAERMYELPRKWGFADFQIIDYHGQGIHAHYRNQGKGQEFSKFIMGQEYVQGKLLHGGVNVATRDETGQFKNTFREVVYALRLNFDRFILAEVLDPPIYDTAIFYGAVMRVPGLELEKDIIYLNIGPFGHNPEALVQAIKKITPQYVGVKYDLKRQILAFQKVSTIKLK